MEKTYQAADHDFTLSHSGSSIVDGLCSGLDRLRVLLDSANSRGGLGGSGAATRATTSALATVDEDLVERLVQLTRHVGFEMDRVIRTRGWQS